jgi:integrase/recombinase XerD
MNRSTLSLSISKAIDGFQKFKVAEGLSQRTVDSYEYYLNQWMNHIGDQDVAQIKPSDLANYLAWMRTEYKPKRWNGNEDPLSAKSLRNVYIALRAFYSWLSKEFKLSNPAKEITPPKFPQTVIQTFSKEDLEKLIKSCVYSREAKTDDRKSFVMRRPSANRDQAIILTLLDTGLRATELCSLTVEDVDLKTGKVNIRHGIGGGAKGGKGRVTYLGKVARKAVWRYLATARMEAIRKPPSSSAPAPDRSLVTACASSFGVWESVQDSLMPIRINSATPSPSPTCVRVEMFSRCNRCLATARWIWCAIMPRLRRWT